MKILQFPKKQTAFEKIRDIENLYEENDHLTKVIEAAQKRRNDNLKKIYAYYGYPIES